VGGGGVMVRFSNTVQVHFVMIVSNSYWLSDSKIKPSFDIGIYKVMISP
jgi:hypothetical protein